jgi:hypothetical protein
MVKASRFEGQANAQQTMTQVKNLVDLDPATTTVMHHGAEPAGEEEQMKGAGRS